MYICFFCNTSFTKRPKKCSKCGQSFFRLDNENQEEKSIPKSNSNKSYQPAKQTEDFNNTDQSAVLVTPRENDPDFMINHIRHSKSPVSFQEIISAWSQIFTVKSTIVVVAVAILLFAIIYGNKTITYISSLNIPKSCANLINNVFNQRSLVAANDTGIITPNNLENDSVHATAPSPNVIAPVNVSAKPDDYHIPDQVNTNSNTVNLTRNENPAPTIDTTKPLLTSQPNVLFQDTSVTIEWTTDEPAKSRVKFGPNPNCEFPTGETDSYNTRHHIYINGLTPGNTYYYQLISADLAGNTMIFDSRDLKFTTLPFINSSPHMGNISPNFKLKTLDGGEVTLSQFKGKKVILNFWASWCSPCKVELPHVQTFWEKYQNNNDVAIVTVAGLDSDVNILKSIVSGAGYKFTVGLDDSDDVFNRYEISSIPRTFFIDKSGVIRKIQRGMFTSPGEIEFQLNSY